MKGKLTTKTIVISIITLILATLAVTGTVIFLKDSGEAAAIEEFSTNLILPVSGDDGEDDEQEKTQLEEIQQIEESTEGDIQENLDANNGGEEVETPTTSTSNTGISTTTQETIENIEETVVTEEKQVLEELSLSWNTIELPAVKANMGVYKPELAIKKEATLVNGESVLSTTRVKPEDKITYEIKVSNIGDYKATDVIVTDSLDVTYDKQKIKAGNEIVNLDVLESGAQAIITVIYEVTEDDVETLEKITNVAYATDGRTTVYDDEDIPVMRGTVSISGNKIWDVPDNTDTTNATSIKIYAYRIEEDGSETKMENCFDELQYGETQYEITGLPQYTFKKQEDGTVKSIENEYVAREEENIQYISTQEGNTITNSPRCVIEEITAEVTTTTTASPVDVVFVLDVSNSMKTNDRIINMTNAVNSAMSTIMNHNDSNRVGIVAFASNVKEVKTAELQSLQHNKNANITYDPDYEKEDDSDGNKAPADGLLSGVDGSITVKGATYTQTGIEQGAEMLKNAGTKEELKGRTPILILITDGEPTYYNTTYYSIGNNDGTSDASNPGYQTTRNCVYYTILTANYWKTEIAKKYNGMANIYTVGMDLDSNAAYATLQPTYNNVNKYSSTLRNNLISAGYAMSEQNQNAANYANEALLQNNLTSEFLTSKLKEFVYNSELVKETSENSMSSTEELTLGTIELENVDDSKDITITYGDTTYTQATAPTGAIEPNGTKYVVNLNKLPELTDEFQLKISYYKK